MVYDFFEELKAIFKEKIKRFYNEKKYILLVIVLIVLILLIFTFEKKNPESVETQQIYIAGISIDNWAQWIATIALPYTAGWTIFQFKKSSSAKKQEKAVEIAREFSDTLVDNLYMINTVYLESGLETYIPKEEAMVNKIFYFNVEEIRRVFKDDDYVTKYKNARNLLKEQLDNIYHIELYKKIMPYSNDIIKLQVKAKNNILTMEDKNKIEEKIKDIPDMPYHFIELVSKTLNKLEFICMNISSKAADSNYIYQSLHQVFLRTIRAFYLEISCININSTDKFYTNIIHVYNIWKIKYVKDKKIEEHRVKKSNEKLNPKIKTV